MNKSTISKTAQTAPAATQPQPPRGAAGTPTECRVFATYIKLLGGQTGRLLASLDDLDRNRRYLEEAGVEAIRAVNHYMNRILPRI